MSPGAASGPFHSKVTTMPELPEVETVRRGLEPWLTDATIKAVTLNRADLRFAFPDDFAGRLAGRRIVALGRRAKYLLATLSDGAVWLSHLGMTGSFSVRDRALAEPSRYRPGAAAGKHEHVVVALDHPRHGPLELVYADPRRFGFMDLFAAGAPNRYLDLLGPEPLGNALNVPDLAARLAARRTSIKAALLDQRVVAGLGNIYVCEALHRAGIAPQRMAPTLVDARGRPRAALERLVPAIRAVLDEALAAGGSTLRDFRSADGTPGYFQHRFSVYDRAGAPCPTPGCAGVIVRTVQSGRSSFHCPRCQR